MMHPVLHPSNLETKCLHRPLHWRHNECDGVSKHRRLDCLQNRLFKRRSKKTFKFLTTGLCDGNPPATGGFPSHRTCDAENFPFQDVIMWWWNRLFYRLGDLTNTSQGLGTTHVIDYIVFVRSTETGLLSVKTSTWLNIFGNSIKSIQFIMKILRYTEGVHMWESKYNER